MRCICVKLLSGEDAANGADAAPSRAVACLFRLSRLALARAKPMPALYDCAACSAKRSRSSPSPAKDLQRILSALPAAMLLATW